LDLHEAIKNNYSPESKVYRCGEVDLMRLILQKPNGPDEDQVTLSLVSGNARVWGTPVKIAGINLPVTYKISQLPKVLWVEATDVSARVGDIELKLTYGTESDSVLATGVWAEHSARSPWHNRQTQDGFPDNPVPGAGFDLPDCTHPPLLDHINTAMATDGSRYGFGPWWKKQDGQGQWYDSHVGGRILLEFEVRPADAPGRLPITWDVTRQFEDRRHSLKNGQHAFDTDGTNFPWEGYPLKDVPVRDDEYPNDEKGQDDNDNSPSNTRIYSWDSPGSPREADPTNMAFYVYRLTLKEWVRVQFDGGTFPNDSNHHKLGSRTSSKYGWHMCGHWKRDAAGNLALDGDLVSYSAPRFKEGAERGAVSVTLLGQAGTDGYTLDYAANDNKWTLKQLSNNAEDSDVQNPGNGVVWTLEIANRVRIQITQNGDDEYADGAQYTLGVYKTAQQSKTNEIEPGDFVVTGDP
jgi:hypothetical protein